MASTPIVYDDSGQPIDSITVEATRLPNWLGFLLATIAGYVICKILDKVTE